LLAVPEINAVLERRCTHMTEREIRALGLDQLTSGLARCAMAGQLIRLEALQTLLSNMGEDTKTREAVIAACKRHPDARWWLLRKRRFGVACSVHWATVLGEEVNQELAGRKEHC